MDGIIKYITSPDVIVSFIIFVFWLGATWSNLNAKLKELEKRIDKIEALDLDARLTEIQTNLRWIMEKLKSK
jgi:uncharacterized protein YoxC